MSRVNDKPHLDAVSLNTAHSLNQIRQRAEQKKKKIKLKKNGSGPNTALFGSGVAESSGQAGQPHRVVSRELDACPDLSVYVLGPQEPATSPHSRTSKPTVDLAGTPTRGSGIP